MIDITIEQDLKKTPPIWGIFRNELEFIAPELIGVPVMAYHSFVMRFAANLNPIAIYNLHVFSFPSFNSFDSGVLVRRPFVTQILEVLYHVRFSNVWRNGYIMCRTPLTLVT